MIRLSLNEIEVTAAKAAVALGWSPAVALETGRAAVWAAQFLPRAAVQVLDLARQTGEEPLVSRKADRMVVERANPATVLSALDFLVAGACSQALFRRCEAPYALICYGGGAARIQGGGFSYLQAGMLAATGPSMCLVPAGMDGRPGDVLVERTCPESSSPWPERSVDGAFLDGEVWRCVQELASKTLVPATRRSRESGAGAGLVDHD